MLILRNILTFIVVFCTPWFLIRVLVMVINMYYAAKRNEEVKDNVTLPLFFVVVLDLTLLIILFY